MRWYGLGAVGFTMLITAVGFQWYLFADSFWIQWFTIPDTNDWTKVPINLYSLMDAMFGVSAVLISFGALIGKVSPLQLMVMTVIELALHSLNEKVLMLNFMKLADLGGTYSDHMFGAYFGLSVAFVLGAPKGGPAMGAVPDIFSLIGTLFLWIYWPSFVSGAAEPDSDQQQMAIVNTILSLSASTIVTFCLSSLIAKDARYRPVDIQNATLAGGVAIGCTANLHLSAFSAIVIGVVAGSVSAFGFNIIQPWLEKTIGLHDSCGIHNLHAMPSVIGALASIFVTAYQQSGGRHISDEIYGVNGSSQWWRQGMSIVVCIAFAVFTGTITGFILKALGGDEEEKALVKEFDDEMYWEVAEDHNQTVEDAVSKVAKGQQLYTKSGNTYSPLV
jgi:ammonium transporter Rh